MLQRAGPLVNLALDLLFPRRCVACGRYGEYLCASCRTCMRPAAGSRCGRCWRPCAGPRCEGCLRQGMALEALRAPYAFEGPARELVHALKYRYVTAVAPLMAAAMAGAADLLPERPDAVVPVPLHKWRERERGFNQAALLARECGKRLGLPIIESELVRWRPTRPQARAQSAASRASNVEGAFACRNRNRFQGAVVALVDDVTTTGSTFEACAGVLRAHGAVRVYGLAFAVDD